MHVLIAIAVKSLLVAGLAIALLQLMRRRSAAERSWVAHIGLLALVIMAFAPLVLPPWNVEAPALLGQQRPVETIIQAPAPAPAIAPTLVSAPATTRELPDLKVQSRVSVSPAAAATAIYAVGAAILLFVTFLAIARLVTLRARADVLVDGHWLSALARAQRRMGFKHGTALLTSNELSSPISWGLMRPVILLNDRAVEASGEAEAIIAHELAHVARMDWVKLLLSRIATALFWFNPLVWLLAREAHQLREEAADDAVLAADIDDTDYAELLVGVARHECPGLLLGAHGVAPSRTSLARRVARVLDGTSVRSPVARSFALGVFVGAVLIAAPLTALTLTPGGSAERRETAQALGSVSKVDTSKPYYTGSDAPADLPHLIVSGVSTSVATVAAAVSINDAKRDARLDAARGSLDAAREAREDALEEAKAAREDAIAEAQEAIAKAHRAVRLSADATGRIDQVIDMRAAGVDADYVNALRAAQPRLRALEPAEFAGMKSIGISPEYARDLAAAGFRNLDADGLAEAHAIGLTGDYARGMAAAGVPLSLEDYVQLRATGVPVRYVLDIRKSGYSVRDPDKIIQMWAVGVKPGDLRVIPTPPRAPIPPHTGRPAASPPDWKIPDSDPDG
jgi:beta-lactamase regulating signal transducer with metallopeptidase domain